MDLKDLTPKSNTVEVILFHPSTHEVLQNDDDTPMTVVMYAQHSPEYKAALYELTDDRMNRMAAKDVAKFKSAEIEESTLSLLSKTTKSWNITFDGEKPNLTEGNARKIYTEVFWIREQLESALATSLDFMKD
jgi:hypothetical protein